MALRDLTRFTAVLAFLLVFAAAEALASERVQIFESAYSAESVRLWDYTGAAFIRESGNGEASVYFEMPPSHDIASDSTSLTSTLAPDHIAALGKQRNSANSWVWDPITATGQSRGFASADRRES